MTFSLLARVCFGISLIAAPASAWAVTETWVSATGTDAGDCTIDAPCRTFQYAHDKTRNGGTIKALSPGSFGSLRINRSISVDGNGFNPAIESKIAGTAVNIDFSGPVILRNLTIDQGAPDGTANVGIGASTSAILHVHNCVIRGYIYGIYFGPQSGVGELYVADTLIADNGTGILIKPGNLANARINLDRVRVENSRGDYGIHFFSTYTKGTVTATVRDSLVAGTISSGSTYGIGIMVFEGGGGKTKVMVDRTASINNMTGIRASGPGAIVHLGESTVHGNVLGLEVDNGGVIASYGTNKVSGNGTDGNPTSTIAYK
jgi:hypothetical protein